MGAPYSRVCIHRYFLYPFVSHPSVCLLYPSFIFQCGLNSASVVRQPLYERCDRLRPALFRLASDTVDDDEALTQILAASDDLTLVLSSFKEQLATRRRDSDSEASLGSERAQPPGKDGTLLVEVVGSIPPHSTWQASLRSLNSTRTGEKLPPHRPLGSGLSKVAQRKQFFPG